MENARRRQIGAIGTAARVVLGLPLLVSGVLSGHVSAPGRTTLADEHSLRSRAPPLQENRHPLAGQRMKWMSDENRFRN